MAWSDEELLQIVGEERKRSLGFGEGDSGELTERRQAGIAYAHGEMVDVASRFKLIAPEGRSAVSDTTVGDAIETLLPDILEVFVGGDDIASFVPQGEHDETQAQLETDYITHVIFTENEGYLALYTALKDALESITGVIHWWTEEDETDEPVGQPVPPEMAQLAQAVAASQGQEVEAEPQEDGTVVLSRSIKRLRVRLKAFPSEDFTCAADTVSLRDATYCAVRDRPRVQDLIARGIDEEKARALPSYAVRNDGVERERDQAGEHDRSADAGVGDLRIVETRAHYIRLLEDDGELCLYRVVTDGQETVLLEKDEIDHIPFAAGTPYIIPHRFYGESVFDKLGEVQRIKTVLLRSHLDSVYFALNQRMEVSEAASSENTIADLMRNAPGVPVRSKTGEAVRPISAGGMDTDLLASLEYASTMAESRSGIVRNAQGLNPDTLHDTAQGAIALIGAAQKRVRLIARNFAETLVKDLFLGIHNTLRTASTKDQKSPTAKLRNKWQTIEPHTWPSREALTIHVGVGSAGKEHDLMVANQRLALSEKAVELQGGLDGPMLTAANLRNQLGAWENAAGSKSADQFWSDPATMPPQPPKPDPEALKVQGQTALAQQAADAQAKLEQRKAEIKGAADEKAAAREFELQQQRIAAESALKRDEATEKAKLERWKADQDLELQRQEMYATVDLKREELRLKASTETDVDDAVEALPG